MNKRTWSLIAAAFALVGIVVWLLAPVYSFKVIVPLYDMNGWTLGYNINALVFVPVALMVLMVLMALVDLKIAMLGCGIVNLIAILLLALLRVPVLLGGNLSSLVSLAGPLLNQAAGMVGQTIDVGSIGTTLQSVGNTLLHIGFGVWVVIMLNALYLLMPLLGGLGGSDKHR